MICEVLTICTTVCNGREITPMARQLQQYSRVSSHALKILNSFGKFTKHKRRNNFDLLEWHSSNSTCLASTAAAPFQNGCAMLFACIHLKERKREMMWDVLFVMVVWHCKCGVKSNDRISWQWNRWLIITNAVMARWILYSDLISWSSYMRVKSKVRLNMSVMAMHANRPFCYEYAKV